KRSDVIARQSILFRVGLKAAFSVAGQSTPSAKPELAFAIFQNGFDIIPSQTIPGRVTSVTTSFKSDQSISSTEPETPCPVLMDGPCSLAEETIRVGIPA